MLVLTRWPGERIVIGGNVVVTICAVNGKGNVRVGVEAPRELSVHREEIQRQIDGWKPREREGRG